MIFRTPTSQSSREASLPTQISVPRTPVGRSLLTCLVAFASVASLAQAELIPANRLANWTPGVTVGVPGGIPNRTRIVDVTKAPYNADNTGASDASVAVRAAINTATGVDTIYLPAGTYRFDSPVGIGSDTTLRGAGPELTKIKYYGPTGSALGMSWAGGNDWLWGWPKMPINGSPKKGATVLNVDSTSALAGCEGRLMQISLKNDYSLPVVSVSGYERVRQQKTRIVSMTANTITISPGLHFDLPSSLSPTLAIPEHQVNFAGIEDLSIDGSNSATPHALIAINQGYACWIKNVTVVKTPNYLMSISSSLQCEVRGCDLRERKTVGTNGAGILMGGSANCLIEDNIIYKIFPHIEINFGSSGNVIAYNFFENNDVMGIMGASIDSNHGPHNSYNLFEGNIASKFQSDGYFGGESEGTLFRNWFHATCETTSQFGICINLNRFARNFSIVGNILGRDGYTYKYDNGTGGIGYGDRYIYTFGLPNMGNGGFRGLGPALTSGRRIGASLTQSGTSITSTEDIFVAGDALQSWVHFDDGQGVAQAGSAQLILGVSSARSVSTGSSLTKAGVPFEVWPGPNGFQELDLDVAATALRKGNYNYFDKAVPASESLGGDALPDSLFRSGKPAWFGDLAWPPFNPGSPNPSYESIPAGYRYVHGSSPTAAPAAAPTNVRIQRQTE